MIPRSRNLIAVVLWFVALNIARGQGGPPMITDDPGTPGDGKFEINLAVDYGYNTQRPYTGALPEEFGAYWLRLIPFNRQAKKGIGRLPTQRCGRGRAQGSGGNVVHHRKPLALQQLTALDPSAGDSPTRVPNSFRGRTV